MKMDEGTDIKRKIATLIFMDLETTGLPFDVGKKNVHVTEMSFVAIDRNSFEDDPNLRAINKLSLCIRPRSVVSLGAMDITGLYNDILQNQEEFDDSVPKLLEYFFRRLQSPICLLAHNGKKFDFPVLQAELKRINYSLDSHILCADTLAAFRSICLLPPIVKIRESLKKDQAKSNDTIHSDDEIECLLSQDLESFATVSEQEVFSPQIIHQIGSSSKVDTFGDFLDPKQNERTPSNRKILPNINARAMNVKKRKIFDSTMKCEEEHNNKVRPIKRVLFTEPKTSSVHSLKKFTLEHIYKHFFNEDPPQSHCAEVDCISLSKVCQKINKEFLQWIDQNSESFCDTNALW